MNIKELIKANKKDYVSREEYSIKAALKRFVYYNVHLRQKERNLTPISTEQRSEIEAYWRKILEWHDKELVNYGYYDVYNRVEPDKEKLKYYIPDSFFYAFIDEYFTNPQRSVSLDDKNLYDIYFHDVNRPKTIARKVNDIFLDEDYKPITFADVVSKCMEHDDVVVKSCISSSGGHGVKFWNPKENTQEELLALLYKPNARYFQGSTMYHQYVIQEVIKQHPTLAKINESVNTIRVITLYRNGKVNVLSSVLRMGIDGSRVDNCSSGGIVCGIDGKGCLKDVAYDATATPFHKHPQGFDFAGVQVPGYEKVLEVAKKLAYRFVGVSRMISWDFAVDENGEPMLIEMNISYGEIDFHQLCNGPIFGEDTTDILKEIYEKNYTLSKIIEKLDEPYQEASNLQ